MGKFDILNYRSINCDMRVRCYTLTELQDFSVLNAKFIMD